MFDGVPVSVNSPPVLVAKARGMRKCDGTSPSRHTAETTAGSSVATVPVLLMKADRAAAPSMTTISSRRLLPAVARSITLPNQAVTPVRDSPSLTTNRAAMRMTVESLKPASAWGVVRMPARKSAIIDSKATKSARKRPWMNRAMVTIRMRKVMSISHRETEFSWRKLLFATLGS